MPTAPPISDGSYSHFGPHLRYNIFYFAVLLAQNICFLFCKNKNSNQM